MAEAEIFWKSSKSDSLSKIKDAISEIGWQTDEESKNFIKASAPSSIFSWGESVEVIVSSKVGKTRILITSEPKWQIIDFGKSEDNVMLLHDKLLKQE